MTEIFCYGTLKRGYGNNRFLENSEFLGEAYSTKAIYSMTGAGIPFLHTGGSQQVAGEIWRVDDETLKAIDRLEGHPRFYKREQQEFFLGDETVVAWVYIARERGHFQYEGEVVYWPQEDRRVDGYDRDDLGESPDF